MEELDIFSNNLLYHQSVFCHFTICNFTRILGRLREIEYRALLSCLHNSLVAGIHSYQKIEKTRLVIKRIHCTQEKD